MSQNTQSPITLDISGTALLSSPLLNKDTAFSSEERKAFGLTGLLPSTVETLAAQSKRAYQQFCDQNSDIDRHIFLRELQDHNETLFFAVIQDHLEEMLPIIYTPTVGQACQTFSHIYRAGRGLFVSYPNRDQMDELIASIPQQEVKVIVVTDGERILGLGDLGVGGMGIPIGKLGLYTACGGIDPAHTLPVTLDVGTNNDGLRNDPMYMGWRHERVRGDEYYDFVDRFIQAVLKRWPNVLLQFEDFAQGNALPLLNKYRDQLCCFNDDIQGTAAVALGTLYSACKARNVSLADQRIVFVGAGSAGCGIAEQIVSAMQEEGLDEASARSRVYMVDRNGLVTDDMQDIPDFQKKLAHSKATLADWQVKGNTLALLDVIEHAKPTIMVGVSGQRGLFSEEAIKAMYANCHEPLIMPLSNPTSRIEATPEEILTWTEGNALVATGSPFAPVNVVGKTIPIAQCNNAYIFPGIGLGVLAVNATRVTEGMLMSAARALSDCSPVVLEGKGAVLPSFKEIRNVSTRIAMAVAKRAQEDGVAPSMSDDATSAAIEQHYWVAQYQDYSRA